MEDCILRRDWVAVVRIIEVTALWIKQYIVYVRWAFGTSNTGRITVGDRLNEVTVDWGSTVFCNEDSPIHSQLYEDVSANCVLLKYPDKLG